jgi:hypothetical protein
LAGVVMAIGATIALTLPATSGLAATHTASSKPTSPTRQTQLGDGIGTPNFEEQRLSGTVSPTANTIPSWSSSFTDPTNGKSYAYTMVGTNPYTTNASTTIPTVIVPMKFTYQRSAVPDNVLDGTDRVSATVKSPMFVSTDVGAAASSTASAPPGPPISAPGRTVNEPSDTTQVADAIYRAQFGKTGSRYHVLLGTPQVQPTVSISVPKNQGELIVGSRSHARIGLMSYSWFSSQLKNLIGQRHISPQVIPIFLVNNTFLYSGTEDNCCTLGYHGATSSLNGNGKQQINTYMFASYSDPGIFGANAGDTESYVADIHGLSHEVQELFDDPFVNNFVNPWLTPTAPQYGCTAYLETGDPVVGYGFKITTGGTTYHPEDEVHYSWFARQSPSIAERGYYTYLNNFAAPATGC